MSEYKQFRSAFQTFARHFDNSSAKIKTPCGINISPTKAHALMKIGSAPKTSLSQKNLAISLGLNKSNITRLVQVLESTNLLKRTVSKLDKRVFFLDLTPKGKKLCLRLEASSKKYIEELLAHIQKSKHKNIIDTLEELNRANTLIKINKE